MSQAPRQTRQIADFDDRLSIWGVGIKLTKIDWTLIVIIGGWIILTLVQTIMTTPEASAYWLIRELHNHLGRFTLFIATVMLAIAMYIGLARHADVTDYFRRGTYVVFGTMFIEGILGAILYFVMGARPGEDVHIIYGMATILALPFFVFVEKTAEKRPAMGSYMWGFGLLAGIITRCMSTGIL